MKPGDPEAELKALADGVARFLVTAKPAERAALLHRLSVLEIHADPELGGFSLAAIAEAYGVNTKTLQREIARGHLRAAKLGKAYWVTRTDLARWVEGRKASPDGD